MSDLNNDEKLTNLETMKHIANVGHFINIFVKELLNRAENHDKTKMEKFEVAGFTEYTPKLKNSVYGSEEYKRLLNELKVTLDHHYANNSHHPEYYDNGIEDMTLVDIIELFCDWKAATMRHDTGNLLKSIEINADRFNIDKQLVSIFKNTVKLIEGNNE